MKKFKAFLLSLFLVCGFIVVTVSASQASNVGFTMSTDKGSYSEKDKIKETFDIKNNAEETLNDLTLLVSVPSGYIVENGGNPLKLGNLEPGKQGQKTVTFVRASLPKQVIQKIKTGVATNTGLYMGLAVASVVVIILLIVLKGKNKNKMMTILLALSLGSGLISINTEEIQAKDIKETVETSITVTINGKKVVLSGKLTYTVPVEEETKPDPVEPILDDPIDPSLENQMLELKEKVYSLSTIQIKEEMDDSVVLLITIPDFEKFDNHEKSEEEFVKKMMEILKSEECPITIVEKTVIKNDSSNYDEEISEAIAENYAMFLDKVIEWGK